MKQTNQKSNILKSFKLYYEYLEGKLVNTVSTKQKTSKSSAKKVVKNISLKKRMFAILQPARKKINNIVKKINQPRKKAKKTTKVERALILQQRKNGILGIWLLLVVVSIAYSTSVTRTFVNSNASLIALAPQAIFAIITIVKSFSKLYK